MRPKTITYEWEDGKILALTPEQEDVVREYAGPDRFDRLLRVLAELPNAGRKE